MTSKEMRQFRLNVNMLMSPNAQGGHFSKKGLSPTGEVVRVPEHRHHVEMSTYRIDVGLQYLLNHQWTLRANVPYAIKNQDAHVEFFSSVSAEDEQAILDNGDIHHRNETYVGFSDLDLLLGYRISGLFKTDDILFARLGTTIPIGKTEENPWKLGDAGMRHLHIQFGTGTFNPIANLEYSLPLYRGMALTASGRGTFPVYENSKTYRGPVELTYTIGVRYRPFRWLSVTGNYLGFYQASAAWAGERDINTGLRYSVAALGIALAMPNEISVSANVMLPLTQATLYAEGDAIKIGSLFSLATSYSF